MKKISVLILTLLFTSIVQIPCDAGSIANQRAKFEQNRIYKNAQTEIRVIIEQQNQHAEKHNLKALESLYSPDFVSSDGFDRNTYFKLIEETWKTYPDISYKTNIHNIDISGDYATVYVTETSVATHTESSEEYQTTGELYSVSDCVYYLKKQGSVWLITSEKVATETSTLKFGAARYIDIKLDAPKQIGAGKYYTATLKVNTPKEYMLVGSINKDNISYPQPIPDDNFRKMGPDNILERVFQSNKDNVNEYNTASVGITHAEKYDKEHIKIYMDGMAFISTRVNVIPENKFIKEEVKNEQSK